MLGRSSTDGVEPILVIFLRESIPMEGFRPYVPDKFLLAGKRIRVKGFGHRFA